jgi:hypothetical protein
VDEAIEAIANRAETTRGKWRVMGLDLRGK